MSVHSSALMPGISCADASHAGAARCCMQMPWYSNAIIFPVPGAYPTAELWRRSGSCLLLLFRWGPLALAQGPGHTAGPAMQRMAKHGTAQHTRVWQRIHHREDTIPRTGLNSQYAERVHP